MNSEKPVKPYSVATRRPAPTSAASHQGSRLRAEPDSSLKSIAFGVSRGTTANKSVLGGIILLVATVLLLLGAASVIRSALDRPDVYKSYMTGECVRVVLADGTEGSCDALPQRYNSHWVD